MKTVYQPESWAWIRARPVADADVEIVGRLRRRAAPRSDAGRVEEAVVENVGARHLQPARIIGEEAHPRRDVVDEAEVGQDRVIFEHAVLRALGRRRVTPPPIVHRRVVRQIGGDRGRLVPKHSTKPLALDVAQLLVRSRVKNGARMPILTVSAAVEELAAIFARNLVQQGDRAAVALLQDGAVGADDRVVDREDVERLAVELEEAGLAGLAVAAAIEAVSRRGRCARR